MTDRGAPEPSVGAVPGSVVWRSVNDAMNEERAAMVEELTRALTPGFGPMTTGLAGMTAAMTPGLAGIPITPAHAASLTPGFVAMAPAFAGMTAPITPVHAASTTPGFGMMTPRLTGFPGWHFGAGVPGIAWPGAKGFIR
ncbi:MAG: hypothetical protein QOD89_2592 [Bradyrhizobium sp.]|nr:hypothetical protein [Bradyrhizobium sp.]